MMRHGEPMGELQEIDRIVIEFRGDEAYERHHTRMIEIATYVGE